MQNKLKLLKKKLSGYDKIAIAFSGGVDSTFLLLCAKEVLGSSALAVTLTGPNFAPDEIQEARDFCKKEEIPQLVINAEEELLDVFSHNPTNRCYLCKHTLFGCLMDTLEGITVMDGTNADDKNDFRPGRKALDELGIISPLEDVGFTKAEIRQALKAMNIPIWDKPAYACLASRIPYGEEITVEKMTAVYRVESALKDLGFKQVRVRHHGDVARIEILPQDRHKFFSEEMMNSVNDLTINAGFKYASLDLGGYKMGNLNKKEEEEKE